MSLILATVITCCIASSAAAGQNVQQEIPRQKAAADLQQYHAMLDAYASGDLAGSIEPLLRWTPDRTTAALAMANSSDDPRRPWTRRTFGLAVMMHTDAAFTLAPVAETDAAFWHIDRASRLLLMGVKLLPDDLRPFAEQWYFIVSRVMRDRRAPYVTQRLLQLGRERLPGSVTVLRESGTLAELFATDYALVGNAVTYTVTHGASVHLSDILARRTGHLNDAVRWLRDAATLDPADEVLALHFGRTLALRRDDDEAARVLNQVLTMGKNPDVTYLAALFTGGLRERQGDLAAAAAAYRAATERLPEAHAAYIGLSEVLQRLGQGDESRQVLLGPLSEAWGPTREPLWWYQFEPPGVAERRLDSFRNEIRR